MAPMLNAKMNKFFVMATIFLFIAVAVAAVLMGVGIGALFLAIFDPQKLVMTVLAVVLVGAAFVVGWKGLAPGYWRFIVPVVLLIAAWFVWSKGMGAF
jgi:hypothetical protein